MAGLVTPLLPGVHEYFAHKYLQLDNIFSSTHQISRYLKIKVYLRCSQNLNKHVFRIYVNLLLTQTQDTSIFEVSPMFCELWWRKSEISSQLWANICELFKNRWKQQNDRHAKYKLM